MRILVIGDAMIDQFVYGEINRMSPEDDKVPVVDMEDQKWWDTRWGGCLNVASNVRSLGAQVSVSSIMPGAHVALHSSSFDAGDYSIAGSTLLKQRIINTKTRKQVARLDFVKAYPQDEIVKYKNYIAERTFLNNFDAVIISDYQKGVVDPYWIQRLSHFDKPIFVDTKNPVLSQWRNVPNVIFKLNQDEFLVADYRDNPHQIVVTCGKNGCYHLDSKLTQTARVEGVQVENPDPVGAGDVFVAALAIKYLETKDIKEAMTFANRAAAISCGKPGTVCIQRDELDQEQHWEDLENRHG